MAAGAVISLAGDRVGTLVGRIVISTDHMVISTGHMVTS
jgi:hypothetical protein